jgi:pimeloyl-ACP methyl ester carboxylesterase
MSAITVGGDLVHYEVLGRGRPVILVHGWLGGWRYWVPTMQVLHLKYRVYALDLFGFGDSGKNPAKYTIAQQVKLLDEFMNQLGLPKAAMIGHGLGAMVITQFALDNQDRVARILVSSVPLFDPGDLNERTPADQHRLLTSNVNPSVAAAPPAAKPDGDVKPAPVVAPVKSDGETKLEPAAAVTPGGETKPEPAAVKSEPDVTIANKPNLIGDATVMSRPGALSSIGATIPSRSDEVRARIEEAALRAASADKTDLPVPTSSSDEPPEKLSERLMKVSGITSNPLKDLLADVKLEALLAKCFKTSEAPYEKLKTDVDKTDAEVLKHSVNDFDAGRMLDMLRLLQMPVVVVHGVDDPLIPQPGENIWRYLTDKKEDSLLPIPLPGVRHFPMLENEQFQRLASLFLEIADVSKLEVKERWVRRTR